MFVLCVCKHVAFLNRTFLSIMCVNKCKAGIVFSSEHLLLVLGVMGNAKCGVLCYSMQCLIACIEICAMMHCCALCVDVVFSACGRQQHWNHDSASLANCMMSMAKCCCKDVLVSFVILAVLGYLLWVPMRLVMKYLV